jgi:hypothetical protein
MEKRAVFGIILIILAVLIILYINAEIANAEKLLKGSHSGANIVSRRGPSADDWKEIPLLKTVRFVGYVIGATGFLILLAGLFEQPRRSKKRGAIYIDS